MQLLLILNLPPQILHLLIVLFHGGRGDGGDVGLLVELLIPIYLCMWWGCFYYFNLFLLLWLFQFFLWFALQKLILFLFGNDYMSFWLVSDVDAMDFVFLILLHILVCEHSFLAHKWNLFVCPHSITIISLLLNFILKLFNSILQRNSIIMPFLCTLKEKLSLLIKMCLHLFLFDNLIFNASNKKSP